MSSSSAAPSPFFPKAAGRSISCPSATVPQMLLAVPGKGVLVHRDALRGADALARALADVTGRLAEEDALRLLSAAEELSSSTGTPRSTAARSPLAASRHDASRRHRRSRSSASRTPSWR